MNPIILGDGLLGSEIHRQTGWDFISRKKHGVDITDLETYVLWLCEGKYDTVINCMAHTDTRDNTRDKHWRVNYEAVKELIRACNGYDLKLVHISTDYIYANSPSFASENDAPASVSNWYSYTKLLSDGLVQLEARNWLMFRCSFKPNPWPYERAWIDLKGHFGYVGDIAKDMIELIKHDAKGIFNVGSKLTSLYDLAGETNRNVLPDVGSDGANRPYDITMSLAKLNFFKNEKEI